MTLEIEWVIPLALGLLLIIVFLVKSQRSDKLKENGVEAEGVIFEIESASSSVDSTSSSNYYPVVRFVTKVEQLHFSNCWSSNFCLWRL